MRGPLPRPRLACSTPGQHDLVDVQEAVLVEADVDEGGLQPGEDVVDAALVDVADDRAPAAALEVDLGYAVAGGDLMGLRRLRERERDLSVRPGSPDASSMATRVSPRSTVTSTRFFNDNLIGRWWPFPCDPPCRAPAR